jgi:DNA polymerase III subunit epsilon
MIEPPSARTGCAEDVGALPSEVDSPVVPGEAPKPPRHMRFAAIDFETADQGRDSACALSIVVVEDDKVVQAWTRLIRPPRPYFEFTFIHGITWEDVRDQPSFGELWPAIARVLEGVDFIAAHNASFDRSVLRACCAGAGIMPARSTYLCTVRLARTVWKLQPTKLSDVCRHLRIPLKHHDAASDANACARIILAAREAGHAYDSMVRQHQLRS